MSHPDAGTGRFVRARNARALSSMLCALLLLQAAAMRAVLPREGQSPLEKLVFAHPELFIPAEFQRVEQLSPGLASKLRADLGALGLKGAAAETGFYDLRGGRWATLIQSRPLIPGSGAANKLSWSDVKLSRAPGGNEEFRGAVWVAFTDYLRVNRKELSIDPAELTSSPNIAVHEGNRLVQIYAQRVYNDVPVRESSVTAVINSGNLILFGTRNWGDIDVSTTPSILQETAVGIVEGYLKDSTISRYWQRPHLILLPTAAGPTPESGYGYRLAWVISPQVENDHGAWEALVDAHSGELLQFADKNQYLERRVVGGIFPVSNDGLSPGGVPDGVEQPFFPMPYADVTRADGTQTFTNKAGLVNVDGTFSTSLSGRYVRINDNCGAIDESTTCRDLNLGTSGGTDCVTPPGHSLGDTHASRTGFYEVNRIIEQAKGWIPNTYPVDTPPAGWLHRQLTANMNITSTCNAFWTPVGGTINFYREGPSATGSVICRNTGEIAGVFDHEWGHGLDNNDNVPSITFPGEAYADIAAILRLNASCIGRGFYKSLGDGSKLNQVFCGGNGDPCTECTGVREDDWKKRLSGKPHDISWVLGQNPNVPGNCGVPLPLPLPTGLGTGPCGLSTHCEGTIVGEAVWDLLKRDLPCNGVGWDINTGTCVGGAPPTIDLNTSLEIVARLFYAAAGNVQRWYQCNPQAGGCIADGGYLQFLAADDDNGLLADGTPHMKAIFDAFNRHQIACAVPAALNGGCAGAPTQAPTVTATAAVNGAQVSWTSVPNAAKYWVFRTEGVHGCNFGKERIAEVTGTSFTDTGLMDGLDYFYSVIPVGANITNACFGPMSACASVVPLAPSDAAAASLTVEEQPNGLTMATGDGDKFMDNCERGTLRFNVVNDGGVPLTNVRITSIKSTSHPQIIITTPLPAPVVSSLAAGCGLPGTSAPASFNFTARGLAHDDQVQFEVKVTADQIAPATKTGNLFVQDAETDLVLSPSVQYRFDTGFEGWQVFTGTYTHVPAGGASNGYVTSSAAQDDACDDLRSPKLILTAGSTLSLQTQFVIEPQAADGSWYDRANVGVVPLETGLRSLVTPDSGRVYNAMNGTGSYTGCNNPEKGWGGAGTWTSSGWSASALGSGPLAGKEIQLSVKYATDGLAALAGFSLDEVTITNVLVPGPDAQSDVCQIQQNQPPDARDDTASTEKNTPKVINVLANDSDPDGNPLTVTGATDPPNGSVVINPDQTITYTPDANFVGTDSFQYTISDGNGGADTARVTVQVNQDQDPTACNEIDDSEKAVEYKGGWHRRSNPAASNGGYHRRMGSQGGGNGSTPIARLVFQGNSITFFYVMSNNGGTGDVYIDGTKQETLSFGPNQSGPENPTFGHKRTYAVAGNGPHEFRLEHRTGAVYVDGFGFECQAQATADPSASAFGSVTSVSTASALEGAIVERTVSIGPSDREVSVVVEGSSVPLTVRLLDPLGNIVATGEALISGLSASGLDAAVSSVGTYRVQVVNVAGAFSSVEISIARMVSLQ